MNACESGDEPLGEAPELAVSRSLSLVDRQAQALREIRAQCEAWRLEVPGEDYDSMDYHYADAGRTVRSILERHGVA